MVQVTGSCAARKTSLTKTTSAPFALECETLRGSIMVFVKRDFRLIVVLQNAELLLLDSKLMGRENGIVDRPEVAARAASPPSFFGQRPKDELVNLACK